MSKNNIYDECKDVVIFNNNINRCFNFILSTFSEMSHEIKKAIKYYNNADRKDYILKLLSLMQPHIELISTFDEGIFSNDYTMSSMKLIPGIDFKRIFNYANDMPTAKTIKKSLFTHLQTIYISAELSKNQLLKYNKVLKKQQELIFNMIKNLNIDENLKDKIAEIETEEAEKEAADAWFDFDKLKELGELFGEDNPISLFAKEIMEEINIGDLNMENIADNFSEKLEKIILVFCEKIQTKFATGEFTSDKLLEELNKILDKVAVIFPSVKEYINPETIEKMFSNKKQNKKSRKSKVDADDAADDDAADDAAADDAAADDAADDDAADDDASDFKMPELNKDMFRNVSKMFKGDDATDEDTDKMHDQFKSVFKNISEKLKTVSEKCAL